MVSNWDVQHFSRLAAGGYWADADGTLMAFFPGFPGLLSLGLGLGVPVAVTGVVVSLACSAVAAGALYRLGGPAAAVAWLFAPTAVFTVVPYTESLFCAAAFWAWERARSDRWVAAVLLAAVACSVRVSGLFLIGALAVMIITTPKVAAAARVRRLALLLVPAAVIAVFATYLHALTGSWTAWYHAQSTGWVRELTWPWQSFLNTIPAVVPGAYADHPWWAAVFRGEMVSMAVGLLVVVWAARPQRQAAARRGAPAVGRGRVGRRAGAGVLAVVLVLLRQPRDAALVPAVDHARRVGPAATADAAAGVTAPQPRRASPSRSRSC